MSMVFVSRSCHICGGIGCARCYGTGTIQYYDSVCRLRPRNPTLWSDSFRRWRISSGLTPRDVAKEVGMSPSEVSEIENGIIRPTMEQKRKLDRYRRRDVA